MINTKRSIILEEGTKVSTYNVLEEPNIGDDGELVEVEPEETIALVGKSTKQFFSEVSLESHRQLQFVPEVKIDNGYNVKNLITDETYIIVAKYPEIIYNEKCATVTRAILCNAKIYISRLVETADRFGNITKEFKDIYPELDVHVEILDSKLITANPGQYTEAKYKVFSPGVDVFDTDRIEILERGKRVPFKLTGRDYTTFKGLTVMELISETRRDT